MRYTVAAAGLVLLAPAVALAQGEARQAAAKVEASVLAPRRVEATDERVKGLEHPDGFRIEKFAEGLVNPRMIAVRADGTVYVTRRDVGDVLMLRDSNGDGRADVQVSVVQRPQVHGIAIAGESMYLVTVNDVYQAPINPDGTLGPMQHIIGDLPDGGQHPNRTVKLGPDGMLYISVGSTCNACEESNQENATLLQVTPDGRQRRIFARGLRNTIGFDWHPETGELWGMDHGTDWLGDETPPEELNRIRLNGNYGWPYIYGDGQDTPHRDPPAGITSETYRKITTPMVLGYTAHAAPMEMKFYRGGQFPEEYSGDAFVAMRGSWNARPAVGYEIVRIRFENGQPKAFEPFIRGFLENADSDDATHFGRPAGIAFMPDGSMLFSDDTGGILYRVSYEGDKPGTPRVAETSPPEAPVRKPDIKTLAERDAPKQMAISIVAADKQAQMQVMSPSFQMGGPIPFHHTAFSVDVSPALSWQGTPEGTKSFAIIMEDPSGSPTLVNHWIAYNIPAGAQGLREGLPQQLRLKEPELLQGVNSLGRIGYTGPRPMDDGVRQYYFQIIALDRDLDVLPGATRDEVLDAMKGHVLGYGVLVGTFQNPEVQQQAMIEQLMLQAALQQQGMAQPQGPGDLSQSGFGQSFTGPQAPGGMAGPYPFAGPQPQQGFQDQFAGQQQPPFLAQPFQPYGPQGGMGAPGMMGQGMMGQGMMTPQGQPPFGMEAPAAQFAPGSFGPEPQQQIQPSEQPLWSGPQRQASGE